MIEVINNRVCVGAQELDGIIGRTTLKTLTYREQVDTARRGCRNTPAAYYVDSLPLKYRTEVYKRFPDLNAQAEARPLIETIEPDGAAYNYFTAYQFADGSYLTNDKIREYGNNASILAAFGMWIDRSNSARLKTSHRSLPLGEFWGRAAAALDRINDNYPNTLPRNARRLQHKFNEFKKQGYEALISGKYKNSNASKVDTDEKKAIIVTLCSDPRLLSDEFICMVYNKAAEQKGWEKITVGTVAKHRTENTLLVDSCRNGHNKTSNTRAMQVARRRPSAALYMISLDGWDCELYYQKRNAKGVTTYNNRKVLELVIDPCCDFILGYAIGDSETSELIIEALRDAANTTKLLFGSRFRVHQVQSDHFSFSTVKEYYAAIGDKVVPAQVGNAKSKPVEPFNAYLNDTYCKMFSNWSGHGVKAKNNPNPEHLNQIKKSFPSEEEVIEQIKSIVAADRNKKLEEYKQFFAAIPEDRKLPFPEEHFLLTFGKTTGYTNVLEGQGVRPRIEGRKMQYDSFDLNFRKIAAYNKWEIRYDSSDLSKVLAVSQDCKYRFLLEQKYVQPMALVERSEGDAAELHKIWGHNDNFFNELALSYNNGLSLSKAAIAGALKALGSPEDTNEYAKALITDSKGQHKTNRYDTNEDIVNSIEEEEPAKKARKASTRRKRSTEVIELPAEAATTVSKFDLY